MRKISAILASLMILTLICSLLLIPVNAATAVNYSVTSASGAQGDTVTVYVKVSSSVAVTGAVLDVNYDSSKLQFVSGTGGGMFATESVRQSGSSVHCTGMTMGDSNAKKSGTFATIKFKILASSGTASLTVKPSSIAQDHVGVGDVTLSPAASGGTITVTKAVTGITLDKTSVTLKKGETAQIIPTVSPSDATNKTVTYTTSNSKVATVSGGKITAVGGGTAKITATAGGKSATCTVNVKVAQTGIAISGSKDRSVAEGSTLKLSTVKVPSDATDSYAVSWSSSDTSVATVSSNGTVTGVKCGTAVITATSNGWKAVYNITVTEKTTESEPESSTDENIIDETSTDENSTDESVTDDSTTDGVSVVEPDNTPTNPNQDSKASFWSKMYNKIFNKDKTVTRGYHYLMLAVTGIVTAGVCIPVTALVTSNIAKNKGKKEKDPINTIEK